MKKQSKFLSLVLRHKPEAGNLVLDSEGWAKVSDVLAALRANFGSFNRAQLQELVDTNDKKRFAFNATGDKIRASQGHSVEVDLNLAAETPPEFLFHGTKSDYLPAIFVEGLKPGSRQHVHLSPDMETAQKVAARRRGNSVILRVLTKEMTDHVFYRSENGVWLTDHVPPDFLIVEPVS